MQPCSRTRASTTSHSIVDFLIPEVEFRRVADGFGTVPSYEGFRLGATRPSQVPTRSLCVNAIGAITGRTVVELCIV